jgi:hypothetical protein
MLAVARKGEIMSENDQKCCCDCLCCSKKEIAEIFRKVAEVLEKNS